MTENWDTFDRVTKASNIAKKADQTPASPVAPAQVSAYDAACDTELEIARIIGTYESGKYRVEIVRLLEKRFAALAPVATEETEETGQAALFMGDLTTAILKGREAGAPFHEPWRESVLAHLNSVLAAQPAGTPEQLRELVAKWRTKQDNVWDTMTIRQCADELEAALAAAPQAQEPPRAQEPSK